ncbi:FAD-dependent monooxygenase [Mucilaginibacter sp. CAU 1740]|uniref:FAD-dependent monooxygenase n=1 Tax=Mucilaginibacter sp. CAU 1740 TaxID=3140365 RepID=UPI00325BC379
MKFNKKILVCGASISGTAIAFWLEKSGYEITIVEKFESFRDGGQNVDIKGYGQEVLKLMGIDQEVNEKNTGELGLKYVNKTGTTISTFPKGTIGGLTSDYEILRGDLARIIYEKTARVCDYRFGKYVKSISEDEDSISATFNDGTTKQFTMIICADGIGSTTRDMAMPEYIRFNYLGAYMSFFTIPKTATDDFWAKAYRVTGGSLVFLRPGHQNETTVLVSFLKEMVEPFSQPIAEQKKKLKEVLSGKGGIADRIVQDLDQVQICTLDQ